MTQLRLHNPTAPEVQKGKQPNTVRNLREARIAILENNKQNAKAALLALASELVERYGSVLTVQGHKSTAGQPATPEVIDELAAESELVLIGSAD